MEDLRPDQKEFVENYIDNGGNALKAVQDTYDTKSYSYAGVKGHRLIKNDKVQEYLKDKAEIAASTVFELVQNAKNEAVKLNASKDVLDRAGYKPIDKTDLTSGGKALTILFDPAFKQDDKTSFEASGDSEEQDKV
jgi:phage terminase small subunit